MNLSRVNPTVVIVAVLVCVISAIALIFGLYAVLDTEQYDRIPGILTSALGVIAPTILGLMALFRAQSISDDLRNGVVTETVRKGTVKALEETGVVDVVSNAPQSNALAMQALARLLEQNTTATQANTTATQTATHKQEGHTDGRPSV